jgi:5,10-methenyltetrahydromethanopterin hydrogenase
MEKLAELRQAHLRWTAETADLGHITEADLIRRLWPPDGVQPTTADPVIESTGEGGARVVRITCQSPGASIVYRFEEEGRWRLYVEPFEAPPATTVWSQANRLGWRHSNVVATVVR